MTTSPEPTLARETRYSVPPRLARASRSDLHRLIMKGFATTDLNGHAPRADACCQFAVSNNELLVRHRPDLSHEIRGLTGSSTELRPTVTGAEYVLAAEINAELSRSQRGSLPPAVRAKHDPRGVRVPVPADELGQWAAGLLARKGLEPRDVRTSARYNVARTDRRGATLPAVLVHARVTGGSALDDALRNGVGRARTYGLGLVTLAPADEHALR